MARPSLPTAGVLSLAGVALFLGAGPVLAQPGGWRSHIHIGPEDPNLTGGPYSSFNATMPVDYGPYPPEWYHWPTLREALDEYGWFGHRAHTGAPADSSPSFAGPIPAGGAAAAPAAGLAATIRVLVPPEAEIWFDDSPTAQGGPQRLFVTPALEEGRSYPYEIRARWGSGPAEVNRTRTIHVAAGDRVTVDFRQPDGAEGPEQLPAPRRNDGEPGRR